MPLSWELASRCSHFPHLSSLGNTPKHTMIHEAAKSSVLILKTLICAPSQSPPIQMQSSNSQHVMCTNDVVQGRWDRPVNQDIRVYVIKIRKQRLICKCKRMTFKQRWPCKSSKTLNSQWCTASPPPQLQIAHRMLCKGAMCLAVGHVESPGEDVLDDGICISARQRAQVHTKPVTRLPSAIQPLRSPEVVDNLKELDPSSIATLQSVLTTDVVQGRWDRHVDQGKRESNGADQG